MVGCEVSGGPAGAVPPQEWWWYLLFLPGKSCRLRRGGSCAVHSRLAEHADPLLWHVPVAKARCRESTDDCRLSTVSVGAGWESSDAPVAHEGRLLGQGRLRRKTGLCDDEGRGSGLPRLLGCQPHMYAHRSLMKLAGEAGDFQGRPAGPWTWALDVQEQRRWPVAASP